MCTAISIRVKHHLFGRNLDFEHTFGEQVVITPRDYVFRFRNGAVSKQHSAMIGTALQYRNYPLYFDGMNEHGLAMAGLNFPYFAEYAEKTEKKGVASFELIPWILINCRTVAETKKQLETICITDEAFDSFTPPSPLHWMVADKEESIVIEQTKDGLFVYDNPVGVLTNSPIFPSHLAQLSNFVGLSTEEPQNSFAKNLSLVGFSKGLGAFGLPGDVSSMSRFVRASFYAGNVVFGKSQEENLEQFFHLLGSVFQIRGGSKTKDGYEMTNYSACMDTDGGVYYYKTYLNSRIRAVDMHRENLDSKALICYDMTKNTDIFYQN